MGLLKGGEGALYLFIYLAKISFFEMMTFLPTDLKSRQIHIHICIYMCTYIYSV